VLVLTREKGDKIILYDAKGLYIEVVVADVCGGKVRIGVTAPQHIKVDREEIYHSKQGKEHSHGSLPNNSGSSS
jgi:carbon storage regulator CsrA